jgi:hypothetical protein
MFVAIASERDEEKEGLPFQVPPLHYCYCLSIALILERIQVFPSIQGHAQAQAIRRRTRSVFETAAVSRIATAQDR